MADAHKNFAVSTVATAPSPAASGTSLVVASGDGTKFPAASFNAVVCPANADATAANAEVIRVTNVSTDTFTITRAQESSSARTITVGDRIYAGPTAKTLTDAENAWQAFAGTYRNLFATSGRLTTAGASGTTYILVPGANDVTAPNPILTGQNAICITYLKSADHAVTELSNTYLRLRATIASANTAIAQSVTFGLYPLTISTSTLTVGTVVSGSTFTITTPSASALTPGTSSDFAFPSEGPFAIGYTLSGTPSAQAVVYAQLQVRNA